MAFISIHIDTRYRQVLKGKYLYLYSVFKKCGIDVSPNGSDLDYLSSTSVESGIITLTNLNSPTVTWTLTFVK